MGESPMRRARFLVLLVSCLLPACDSPGTARGRAGVTTSDVALPHRGALALPNEPGSIRFAVIGDSGTGSAGQLEVGRRMAEYRERFSFGFVLMLGDNIYETPARGRDYEARFERPYEELLRAGVRFHAVLGNHDDPEQVRYPRFNMGGHRYYSFGVAGSGSPPGREPRARFFALDSTNLDAGQRAWLERELGASDADWNVCFFHHPVYTPGRYASWWWRRQLEPLLVRGGADVVFAGHDHLYARLRPQGGIQHFVSGGAGNVRAGDLRRDADLARGYDADLHFLLVEITRDALHFQAIGRTGQAVDAGVVHRDEQARPR
jgi:predicted phosphodiesterase